ncbi:hypothetical protein [Aeromonas hydrophila]|uniref:hypothetical protein n=1 Tax=Aeromonas hydrophila TaxID=644 RepID=UPI002B49760B|nr:hypothetical protein [Aeromonas hydrophila]
MEIKLETRVSSQAHLASLLKGVLPAEVRIMHKGTKTFRGVDPTVLVAVVGAGGTVVGALITGLLSVLAQARAKSIIVVGKSGWRVEVPSTMTSSDLHSLIDEAKELDIEKIIVDK